jgi:hypothetical protein
VLGRVLQGLQFNGVSAADGLSATAAGSADQPKTVMGELGRGLVLAVHDDSDQLSAQLLGINGSPLATIRVDSLQNTAAPQAVAAMAGQRTDLIAWQQNPGTGTAAEIRARYSPDAVSFGPELVISAPALGPANAALGLAAAGDNSGNAAVAWVQGGGDAPAIVADQLYQPPGSFAPMTRFRYVRSAKPVLSWSQARDHWGPVRYAVTIDQAQVFQTNGTSLLVPAILANGPHSWLVTASNPVGLAVRTRVARVWVDTVAPAVNVSVTGVMRVGRVVHAFVAATDAPPPLPPATASGIASITIRWGAGKSERIRHNSSHIFTRRGHYKLTIVAVDRAGNKTTLVRVLKIAPKPKPKKKKHKKTGHRPPTPHHATRAR